MGLPGATKEESIDIFLKAIRNSSNEIIFPQLKRALNKLGVSDREISYYQITGKRTSLTFETDFDSEMKDFTKELNEELRGIDEIFDETFETLNKRKKSTFSAFIAAFLIVGFFVVAGVIAMIFASTIGDKETPTKDIPAITELAPMQDGDKL